MDMTDAYSRYIHGCGERPGVVIIERKKDDGHFEYETISSQAWYHGMQEDATPGKNRSTWTNKKYIELSDTNNADDIKKQLNLLNSLKLRKPLMQKSGSMSKAELVKAVDKISKGLESKLI